ncbi:MAG: bifunctional phosphoglucose/phosphomannose isomerase [Chitinophagia bacterium]|nr:bifunctional phosphoglucose/phosphomannose isomerase [Chitinophagia bacterium]
MKNLVVNFSRQLQEALAIGKAYSFTTAPRSFINVVVSGLGGSGIGGSIVQNYMTDKLAIPFIVNKDYFLPAFVSKDSLVIVCSYSGNTEETIAAMMQALEVGATVMCITSGGKIAQIAAERGLDCILVPGGMPPRACIGYSVTQLLYTLCHFGLTDNSFEAELTASYQYLDANAEQIQQQAADLTAQIIGKLPIIYSAPAWEGVAVRFRQQLNENSKMLCWHAVIPEMNHNELVGWRDDATDKVVILLRNHDDYERTQTRMEINKTVFQKHNATILEIYSTGTGYWEKAFYLIHLTDHISVMLADLRQLDATEVKVIDFLKGELAKN